MDDDTKKRLSKANSTGGDSLSDGTKENDVESTSDDFLDVKKTFMDKHRNVSKNWHIPSSFPSDSVISAYTNPQVDESTEPFTWGKPDLPLLRKLCWEKFGWANQKANELLVPVLKEYNKHETQLRLEAFYTFNEKFAKIRSQRIKRAVKGITGNSSSGLMGDIEQGTVKLKKKRRRTSKVEENSYKKHSDGRLDNRKASTQLEEDESGKLLSDERRAESLVQSGSVVKETSNSNVNGESRRGRRVGGRGDGRGRKRGTGRGRREIEELSFESVETGSSDSSSHSTGKEKQIERTCSPELRRSLRQRKHVQYAEENPDDDDISDLPRDKREICLDEPAAAQEANDGSNVDGNNDDCDMGAVGDICDHSGRQSAADGDYLLSGGGFCIDDTGNPTKQVSGVQQNPDDSLPKMTGATGDLNMDSACTFDGNLKSIQEPLQETLVRHAETAISKEQETEHRTDHGFTAMTSLRRKRK